MKRVGTILLAFVMVLSLTACGGAAKIDTENNLWQEQYDLGIKYLSDGNYEEAIIAFTVAIEIDPKQSAAYEGAAKAYEAMGDLEAAKAILEQGIAATEDAVLVTYLESLAEQLELLSTPPSPETAPEFSEGLRQTLNGADISNSNLYIPLSRQQADRFSDVIEAGLSESIDQLRTLLPSEDILKSAIEITSGKENFVQFWTMLGDALLSFEYVVYEEGGKNLEFNYRPAAGKAFYYRYEWNNYLKQTTIGYSIGSTTGDWFCNGAFRTYQAIYLEDGTLAKTLDIQGTVANDFYNGDITEAVTTLLSDDPYDTYTEHKQYQDGKVSGKIIWSNGSEGAPYSGHLTQDQFCFDRFIGYDP